MTYIRTVGHLVTKKELVPPIAFSHDAILPHTSSIPTINMAWGFGMYQFLDALAERRCQGSWKVPENFVQLEKVAALVLAAASANVYCNHGGTYGKIGEDPAAVDFLTGYTAEAMTADVLCELMDIKANFVGIAKDDQIGLYFARTSNDALDTLGVSVRFLGWLIEYVATRN